MASHMNHVNIDGRVTLFSNNGKQSEGHELRASQYLTSAPCIVTFELFSLTTEASTAASFVPSCI